MDLRERGSATRRHPWEIARARFVLETLTGSGGLRPAPRVLDVGAGDAFVAGLLASRLEGARVVAWTPLDPRPRIPDRAGSSWSAGTRGPFDAVLLLERWSTWGRPRLSGAHRGRARAGGRSW
jgi:hypothetical protein